MSGDPGLRFWADRPDDFKYEGVVVDQVALKNPLMLHDAVAQAADGVERALDGLALGPLGAVRKEARSEWPLSVRSSHSS